MERAYAALGRAVASAQFFDTALAPILVFFRIPPIPDAPDPRGGQVPAEAFRLPVRQLIQALSEQGTLAPDLETRLVTYFERRHLLIHRWFQEQGWPADEDAEGFAPVLALADQVESEAMELTRIFTGYMVGYADPAWSNATVEAYKVRMWALYHRAHLEG